MTNKSRKMKATFINWDNVENVCSIIGHDFRFYKTYIANKRFCNTCYLRQAKGLDGKWYVTEAEMILMKAARSNADMRWSKL